MSPETITILRNILS